MGGSSKSVTIGYRYNLGIHMILCQGPVDKMTSIEVDNKMAWSGPSTGGTITVDSEDLFGGDQREGGVSGTIDFEMGSDTQPQNNYLLAQLGSLIPAYRGVVGVVLNQVYLGLNPYPKRWAFWLERIHVRQNGIPQWYDEKAAIGNDMNPSHIIYECLTDPNWGMGYPDDAIDLTSFMASADTLFSESMGISLLWDKSITVEDFIKEVLKHVDGSLYISRTTGKFVLTLARADYDVNTLLVLDQTNVDKITDFKRNTVSDLVNSVTVIYTEGDTGKKGSITVQDIALAAQQQATIGTTKQFPGFSNGTIASQVASRCLRALSVPLASATIYTNRTAANLNIGDVFVLDWPRFGFTNMVMRVANIELGSLNSNLIKISAMEDVFAISSPVYSSPPPSGWVNPSKPPAPCPYHVVDESTYWELIQRRGETEGQATPATSGFVIATGVRPSGDSANSKLYTNPTASGYTEAGTVDYTPTAVLTNDVSYLTSVWDISSALDTSIVVIGSYGKIDDELFRVDGITATTLTVARGVLDTVPKPHTATTRIFFPDVTYETDQFEYMVGETAKVKLLPTTSQGTLVIGLAPEQTVVIQGRHAKPYVPQNVTINAVPYPEAIVGTSDLVVAWSHRDRLQQTATLIGTTDGNIGPEAGTTYTAEIRTQVGNTLIVSHAAITGDNTTFTTAELGSNYGALKLLLWAERDGLLSYQTQQVDFIRTGFGLTYAQAYGGV